MDTYRWVDRLDRQINKNFLQRMMESSGDLVMLDGLV